MFTKRNLSLSVVALALGAIALPATAQSSGKGNCCQLKASCCTSGANCCKADAAIPTRDYLVQNGKRVVWASQVDGKTSSAKSACCSMGAICCASGCGAK